MILFVFHKVVTFRIFAKSEEKKTKIPLFIFNLIKKTKKKKNNNKKKKKQIDKKKKRKEGKKTGDLIP